MANPFNTRATEFVRSNEAFLTLVSAEPLTQFLVPQAKDGDLFNRLVSIQGQPGRGKTTLSRLFEFPTLSALLRVGDRQAVRELITPLQKCGALKGDKIEVLACRIPLESDFRELWQLPYSEKIRADLFERLIQARAVIAWFGDIEKIGYSVGDIEVIFKGSGLAANDLIGGSNGGTVIGRARSVESAIYNLIGALVPPAPETLDSAVGEAYPVFDAVDSIRINSPDTDSTNIASFLRPLVILDDAHFLHHDQLVHLRNWLIKREIGIGRWILSRLDVLDPQELFSTLSTLEDENPGITVDRDLIKISLHNANRATSRKRFASMARQMSQKAIRHMPIFEQNNLQSIEGLLKAKLPSVSKPRLDKFREEVIGASENLKISSARLNLFKRMAEDFLSERGDTREEMTWAIVNILVHRYVKRTPQVSLFEEEDPDPSKPLEVDGTVYDGARIHLHHRIHAPYYYGFDALSDTASENAEVFMNICSNIVEAIENLLIKQKAPALAAKDQHALIVARATKMVDDWNFPNHRKVEILCKFIADKCLSKSLESNAPLGHGANAYGMPQASFDSIPANFPEFANVLKFGVAYNAITCIPNYDCKNRKWCLIELGGPYIVKSGLPFKKGGFVEGAIQELITATITK